MSVPGSVRLDLEITMETVQQGALQVLREIRPQWAADDVVFKTYTEGITNKLVGCRLRDDADYNDAVLIRIFGDKTEVIIDREIERLAMYVLSQAGCGKPLHAEFSNGLAYGFIAGNCLDENTVRDQHIGSLVAREMVRLAAIDPRDHSEGVPPAVMDRLATKKPVAFTKMRAFLAEAPTEFPEPERTKKLHRDIRPLPKLAAEIDNLEAALSRLGCPIVLCHNDLLLKNIVHSAKDDRCYFIDYEYIGFNFQAYDIGNHFCEWAGIDEVDYSRYPDKPTQMVWLRSYLSAYKQSQGAADTEPTETELETLYVQANKMALASHMFWGVWALIQARYSTIDFDYLDYAKIRLDEYFRKRDEFLSLQLPDNK